MRIQPKLGVGFGQRRKKVETKDLGVQIGGKSGPVVDLEILDIEMHLASDTHVYD